MCWNDLSKNVCIIKTKHFLLSRGRLSAVRFKKCSGFTLKNSSRVSLINEIKRPHINNQFKTLETHLVWLFSIESDKLSPISVISPVYDFVFISGHYPCERMSDEGKFLKILQIFVSHIALTISEEFVHISMKNFFRDLLINCWIIHNIP